MIEKKITKDRKNKMVYGDSELFPKYMSSFLNVINGFVKGTSPKVVGQLTEYFREVKVEHPNGTLNEWEIFYNKKEPMGFDNAFKKVKKILDVCINTVNEINDSYIKKYQRDLIINKTYLGLNTEYFIKNYLKIKYNAIIKNSSEQDESKNIDFYLNNIPIQIKPISFEKTTIKSRISVDIIKYVINKDKTIIIYYEEELEKKLEKIII